MFQSHTKSRPVSSNLTQNPGCCVPISHKIPPGEFKSHTKFACVVPISQKICLGRPRFTQNPVCCVRISHKIPPVIPNPTHNFAWESHKIQVAVFQSHAKICLGGTRVTENPGCCGPITQKKKLGLRQTQRKSRLRVAAFRVTENIYRVLLPHARSRPQLAVDFG